MDDRVKLFASYRALSRCAEVKWIARRGVNKGRVHLFNHITHLGVPRFNMEVNNIRLNRSNQITISQQMEHTKNSNSNYLSGGDPVAVVNMRITFAFVVDKRPYTFKLSRCDSNPR